MRIGELIAKLQAMPQDATIVVDERDNRGGYLWDITAVFEPDPEYDNVAQIRCQEVYTGKPEVEDEDEDVAEVFQADQ